MLKDDLNNREVTGKVLTSAGMGKKYFESYRDWENQQVQRKEHKRILRIQERY